MKLLVQCSASCYDIKVQIPCSPTRGVNSFEFLPLEHPKWQNGKLPMTPFCVYDEKTGILTKAQEKQTNAISILQK
jgi:hypothetical protein